MAITLPGIPEPVPWLSEPESATEPTPLIDIPTAVTPTTVEMLMWRDNLASEWSEGYDEDSSLDDQQENEENLYLQKFEVLATDDRWKVKTGSAPADVDAAVDTLVPLHILTRGTPARATEAQKKKAAKLALAARGLLQAWRKPQDNVRRIVTDQCIRRYAIVRVLFDERLWPKAPFKLDDEDPEELTTEEADEEREARKSELAEWEAMHRRELPIILDVRQPRTVRWREYRGKMLVVVEDYRTTVLEAKEIFQSFPEAIRLLRRREDLDEVRVSDVWKGDWRAVYLDDEPIFPGEVQRHGYREIPYVVFPFRETTFVEPARRFRGLLTNAAGLYSIESSVMTATIYMLMQNAWRTYKGHTVDGRELDIRPGRYMEINNQMGEYLEMIEGAPIPPELLQTEGVVDQMIQRNSVGTPRGAEHTRSAQQAAMFQAAKALKVEAARQALITGLERCLELAFMEIEENLREPLTIPVPGRDEAGDDLGHITIRPRDIGGYYNAVHLSFGQRVDPAMLEQAKVYQAFAQNNFLSMETAWEKSEIVDDPQQEMDRLVRQGVERLPIFQELAALHKIALWFGEDSEEYRILRQKVLEEQQAQKQQQAGPGGGGMGGPPNPGAPGVPTGGHQQPPSAAPRGGGGSGGAPGGLGAQIGQNAAPHAAAARGRPPKRTGGQRG